MVTNEVVRTDFPTAVRADGDEPRDALARSCGLGDKIRESEYDGTRLKVTARSSRRALG
jgi:hypothetical protein